MFTPTRRLITVILATMAFGGAPATKLGFTVHHDGRGAEGLDDIWRGTLDRPNAGVIEIRIERGARTAHGFVFVSHDTLARSFGATVTGRIEGETVHLAGPIDVGKPSGATIDLTMRAGHGTIRVRHRSSLAEQLQIEHPGSAVTRLSFGAVVK